MQTANHNMAVLKWRQSKGYQAETEQVVTLQTHNLEC